MALTVEIGGDDYTAELVHESLVVHQAADKLNSTCSFDLIIMEVVRENAWTVGTTRVEDGDVITGHTAFAEPKVEVSIKDGATTYFGGILSRITVKPKYVVDVRGTIDASSQIITCHCHDFNVLLEEAIIERSFYENKTDEFIIDDLFDDWVNADPPNYGIGRDAHVDGGAYTFDQFSVEYVSVREAMSKIEARTGYRWYVDYDKELHYSETGDAGPAWSLGDAPDDIDIFAYLDPIRSVADVTNLINKVHVRGDGHGVGVTDAESIAKYGVHAVVIKDATLKTSVDVIARAVALRDKFKDPKTTYIVRTYKDGLRAGMRIRFICAHLDIDETLLIQRLTVKFPVDGEPIYELTLGETLYPPPVPSDLPPPPPPREWAHDIVFTSDDANTVSWAGGMIRTSDALEFTIAAGDTGNMTLKTLVYIDIDISETELQRTIKEEITIGPNRFIVAICWPDWIWAGFQVFGASSGGAQVAITATNVGTGEITGPKISPLAIDTGHLVDGAVEHAKTNIAKLSDITVDLGIVTAGEFRAYAGVWDAPGCDGFRLNEDEFAGQENGVDQVVILAADGKLTAGAGAVVLDEDGIRLVGDGVAGNSRKLRFRDDSSGERTLGGAYGDWGGGANLAYTWVYAHRGAGDPWPANIQVTLAAVDDVAGTDVRLTVGSGGTISLTECAVFYVEDCTDFYIYDGSRHTIRLTGGDAVFILGDNAGAKLFKIRDSDTVDRFTVDSDGNVETVGTIKATGTIRAGFNDDWKLGDYTAGVQTDTGFVDVNINGVGYRLLCRLP